MQPPVTASGDARSRVCVSLSVHEGFFRDKDHREGGSKILIRSDSRISSTNDLYIYIYIYVESNYYDFFFSPSSSFQSVQIGYFFNSERSMTK